MVSGGRNGSGSGSKGSKGFLQLVQSENEDGTNEGDGEDEMESQLMNGPAHMRMIPSWCCGWRCKGKCLSLMMRMFPTWCYGWRRKGMFLRNVCILHCQICLVFDQVTLGRPSREDFCFSILKILWC